MKYVLLIISVLCLHCSDTAAGVVVTSKPLYFVVAPLMKGIEAPKLLVTHGHCAHHHHVRPSEIGLIKSASIVFWNGAVHEPFLEKSVSLAKKNMLVFDELDGFSWLSPAHVISKLPAIVTALKQVYPKKLHDRIDSNTIKFQESLALLHQRMQDKFACIKEKLIITSYPFLTYYAKAYGLEGVAHMMGSPEETITPQRLKNVYKTLEKGNVIGIIKDHHVPMTVVENAVRHYKTRILTVDVEAVDTPICLDGYHILIETLTRSIVEWAQ